LHWILQILYAESLDRTLIICAKSFFPVTYQLATILYPLHVDDRRQTTDRQTTTVPARQKYYVTAYAKSKTKFVLLFKTLPMCFLQRIRNFCEHAV